MELQAEAEPADQNWSGSLPVLILIETLNDPYSSISLVFSDARRGDAEYEESKRSEDDETSSSSDNKMA